MDFNDFYKKNEKYRNPIKYGLLIAAIITVIATLATSTGSPPGVIGGLWVLFIITAATSVIMGIEEYKSYKDRHVPSIIV